MSQPREVTVLGSTGSIGRQAIAVARQNPDRIRITGLAAGGGDVATLAEQALALGVRTVAVARATAAQDLQLAFYAAASKKGWSKGEYSLPEILAGPRAAEELAARPADVVLNGIAGSIGLGPTLSALRAGRTVALANKESLIAGGTWSSPPPRPASSSRSTPSTRRWRSACGPARAASSPGWCSPPAAGRSAAGRPPSWRASPSSRRWPTPPGTWGRSSPSTRRRWSTRAWS